MASNWKERMMTKQYVDHKRQYAEKIGSSAEFQSMVDKNRKANGLKPMYEKRRQYERK